MMPMTDNKNEHVIIIHGMGLYPFWMRRIERHLKKAGYHTHNIGYPSRKFPIPDLVENHIKPAIDAIPDDATALHFVTHSLGSILLRCYHEKYTIKKSGRTVMMGPPNQGSEVADALKNFKPYKWYFGAAGQALGTKETDIPPNLSAVKFELGIIAGRRHWMHLIAGMLAPRPNDGLVSVQSTKVKGMKDHIVLPIDHSMMTFYKPAIIHMLHFLKNGAFKH